MILYPAVDTVVSGLSHVPVRQIRLHNLKSSSQVILAMNSSILLLWLHIWQSWGEGKSTAPSQSVLHTAPRMSSPFCSSWGSPLSVFFLYFPLHCLPLPGPGLSHGWSYQRSREDDLGHHTQTRQLYWMLPPPICYLQQAWQLFQGLYGRLCVSVG